MAIMSVVLSLALGVDIYRDGYIMVNGQPRTDLASILEAVGVPLLGVIPGLALFYLVPKVRRNGSSAG
jgi:hypothetical protein